MSTPGMRPSKGLKSPLIEQGSIEYDDNDSNGNKGSDSKNDYKYDVSDIYKLNPEDLK